MNVMFPHPYMTRVDFNHVRYAAAVGLCSLCLGCSQAFLIAFSAYCLMVALQCMCGMKLDDDHKAGTEKDRYVFYS